MAVPAQNTLQHLILLTGGGYAETGDRRFYAVLNHTQWTVTDRQGQFRRITCDNLAYADQILGEILAEPTAFTCQQSTHQAPATHIVDAQVHIGVDTFEPLSWLTCSDLSCLLGAAAHAEAIGWHVDTRPIRAGAVEVIAGLQAGAA